MTTKEFIRLKNFIKSYGDKELMSHSFLHTQLGEFVIRDVYNKQKELLGDNSFLGIPYKNIKTLSLYIHTRSGTFYF